MGSGQWAGAGGWGRGLGNKLYGSEDKKSACSMGGLGSSPGLRRSPGEGHGSPLQYSCLENPCGQRSLVGPNPCCKEPDMTEQLSTNNT